jgi:hypothetical protein
VNNPTTNGTLPFIDLLGPLSQVLGGSADDLDGYIIVTISDLEFNLETQAVEIDATISSPNGTLFYNISWTSPNGSLGAPASETESDILAKGNSLESENTTSVIFPIRTRASILHNASSPHAVAAFNQALIQHLHDQCSDSATTVRSFNEPLPLTTQVSTLFLFLVGKVCATHPTCPPITCNRPIAIYRGQSHPEYPRDAVSSHSILLYTRSIRCISGQGTHIEIQTFAASVRCQYDIVLGCKLCMGFEPLLSAYTAYDGSVSDVRFGLGGSIRWDRQIFLG